ncbi:MAG: alpha/beta hydrolase [Alphaproteobacteria bacterium]|nr:alpha/beta hydrolase [Alphaproteobacteria bacterium]
MRRWLVRGAAMGALLLVVAGALLYTPDIAVDTLRSRYASARSRFIDIGGAAIHIRDEGRRNGAPLFLLHGSNESLQVWEEWTRRLGDSFRIVSLDLPGHGLTGPWPSEDYSVAAYAELVIKVADWLHVPQFAVGGHSMGGAVAWTLAARWPDRISRLILVDSAAYPRNGAAPLSLRLARTPVIGEITAYFKPCWLVERGLRTAYADPASLTPARLRRHCELMRRTGNRAATLRRLRHAPPLDPAPLPSLNVQTLILWGAQDRWVPPIDAARLRNEIGGSELVVYVGAGHMPMEEVPDKSAADVRRFMSE